jgi:hypothetical protein
MRRWEDETFAYGEEAENETKNEMTKSDVMTLVNYQAMMHHRSEVQDTGLQVSLF